MAFLDTLKSLNPFSKKEIFGCSIASLLFTAGTLSVGAAATPLIVLELTGLVSALTFGSYGICKGAVNLVEGLYNYVTKPEEPEEPEDIEDPTKEITKKPTSKQKRQQEQNDGMLPGFKGKKRKARKTEAEALEEQSANFKPAYYKVR